MCSCPGLLGAAAEVRFHESHCVQAAAIPGRQSVGWLGCLLWQIPVHTTSKPPCLSCTYVQVKAASSRDSTLLHRQLTEAELGARVPIRSCRLKVGHRLNRIRLPKACTPQPAPSHLSRGVCISSAHSSLQDDTLKRLHAEAMRPASVLAVASCQHSALRRGQHCALHIVSLCCASQALELLAVAEPMRALHLPARSSSNRAWSRSNTGTPVLPSYEASMKRLRRLRGSRGWGASPAACRSSAICCATSRP